MGISLLYKSTLAFMLGLGAASLHAQDTPSDREILKEIADEMAEVYATELAESMIRDQLNRLIPAPSPGQMAGGSSTVLVYDLYRGARSLGEAETDQQRIFAAADIATTTIGAAVPPLGALFKGGLFAINLAISIDDARHAKKLMRIRAQTLKHFRLMIAQYEMLAKAEIELAKGILTHAALTNVLVQNFMAEMEKYCNPSEAETLLTCYSYTVNLISTYETFVDNMELLLNTNFNYLPIMPLLNKLGYTEELLREAIATSRHSLKRLNVHLRDTKDNLDFLNEVKNRDNAVVFDINDAFLVHCYETYFQSLPAYDTKSFNDSWWSKAYECAEGLNSAISNGHSISGGS